MLNPGDYRVNPIKNTSWIELDKQAYQNNYRYIHSILKPNVKYSAVIKGNAYGHGIEKMVPLMEEAGADHFSVFSAYEAYKAFKSKKSETKLMIMGEVDDSDAMEWVIGHDIDFFVFDMARLELAVETAKKWNKKAGIHLELETGMHRTGFDERTLSRLAKFIREHQSQLEIKGMTTHYAGAENIANHIRISNQITTFNRLSDKLRRMKITAETYHTACSAATINFRDSHMDMVRLGILSYGFWPSRESFVLHIARKSKKNPVDPLKRVISWKTKVMSLKKVNVGEFIGYGTSYLAERDMTVAAIPVGYSYGFSRLLSNTGQVLIKGKKAPVVGTVNMNMTLVDITLIKGVKKGDEVVLIGDQGKMTNTVSSFSEMTQVVNYEMLTRLPADIPRIVV